MSTWASTDPVAQRVDDHQYQIGEGACLDAVRTGQASFVDCLASEERWPAFTRLAPVEGLSAVYCLPLSVEDRNLVR